MIGTCDDLELDPRSMVSNSRSKKRACPWPESDVPNGRPQGWHVSSSEPKTIFSPTMPKRCYPPDGVAPKPTSPLHGKVQEPPSPEFRPISQESLAAEIKGIYAGLVMVEAKCINIDAQRASADGEMSSEQWKALIALHRLLLYEHHDFLCATQHPSANPALLSLANKYDMPTRMWKHATWTFLELLQRSPNSQEHLLAFIDLSYRMMTLLLQTIPAFTEIWVSSLRDITRYLMAFEQNQGGYGMPPIVPTGCAERLSNSLQTCSRMYRSSIEPSIDGQIVDVRVTAFPDTGAAANFISLRFAERHSCVIDQTRERFVGLGDSSTARTLGTAKLPFSFAGESKKHDLVFNVLRESLHDVILGGSFLRTTKTLTHFRHRIERRVRAAYSHDIRKICLLGSQLLVNGLANGAFTAAIPDTGADVSLMSASFARAQGFTVNTEEEHRLSFRLANGSTARALGAVEGVAWRYGIDNKAHMTDVYVLPKLPVDVVLGFEFLCQTDAFFAYEDVFWDLEHRGQEEVLMLNIIQMLSAGKFPRFGRSSREWWQSAHLSKKPLS